MRPLTCLAAALLCAHVANAAPKPAPNQAKKYLDAAVRLYNAFEFERALAQLEKARAQSEGAEMDVTIALYEGIMQLELGRDEQAETSFKTALSLDANASLPTRVSPKVQQLFDGLKATMTKPIPPPPPKEEPKPLPPPPPPKEEPTPLPPPVVEQKGSAPAIWWVPAAAGAALAAGGVVCLFLAKSRSDQLSGRAMADLDLATAERYRGEGKTFQALGFTGISLGIVGVAASAGLLLFGSKMTVALGPDGAAAAVAFDW